jgi:hypothetical protein
MKVSNKNKSQDKTKHVCDFCGKESEFIWEGMSIEGQYCFEHFRLMHDDVEKFDTWCIEFKEFIGERK